MQSLPLESIDMIITFLNPKDLARYACLSTNFRGAVERRTFQSITFKSTELGHFRQLFNNQRRCSILKDIVFRVILPEYGEKYYAKYERESDREANNEVYTRAIKSLFELLSSWERRSDMAHCQIPSSSRGISLEVQAYSPSDTSHRPEPSEPRKYSDLRKARYERSFLQVLEPQSIPVVQIINSFRILTWNEYFGGVRHVDPASVANLAGRMSGLDRIVWSIPDDENWIKYADARQKRRYNFAQSLSKLSLYNLTSLQLQFGYWEPSNHSWQPHSALHVSHPETDYLSLSLNKLTQARNLRRFYFHRYISLSPVFFWPKSEIISEAQHQPLWPSLQEFFIDLSIVSPDGSWLFESPPDGPEEFEPGTPGYSSPGDFSDDSDGPDSYSEKYEEHMTGKIPWWGFRSRVRLEPFAQWVKSMARATECMPKLQAGTLCMTPEAVPYDSVVEVQCRATKEGENGKEWEFQLGKNVGEPVDENLVGFLEKCENRKGCVQVYCPGDRVLSEEYQHMLSQEGRNMP